MHIFIFFHFRALTDGLIASVFHHYFLNGYDIYIVYILWLQYIYMYIYNIYTKTEG